MLIKVVFSEYTIPLQITTAIHNNLPHVDNQIAVENYKLKYNFENNSQLSQYIDDMIQIIKWIFYLIQAFSWLKSKFPSVSTQ